MSDAVVIGIGTAMADDPTLTYRRAPKQERYRVILDTHARLPLRARVLNDEMVSRTIIATTELAPASRVDRMLAKGAAVWVLPRKGPHLSLRHALQKMGECGFLSIVCEGGGGIAHALQASDLVDEITLFMAPRCLGGQGLSAMDGQGWLLSRAPQFKFSEIQRVGPDLMIRAVRP